MAVTTTGSLVVALFPQTKFAALPSGTYNNPVPNFGYVLGNPNLHNLYTTNQIHNLGLGGIILNRDTNNELTLNYQILESTDLVNWTTNSLQLPITNAPTNKMFLRVQAVGQ